MDTRTSRRLRGSRFHMICATAMTILGAALLIAGFVAPPMGVIDSSVLVAFGEVMTFVGAVIGIDYSARTRE